MDLCAERLALAYDRIGYICALTGGGLFQIRIASARAVRSSRCIGMVTAAVAAGCVVSANGGMISGPYISAHRTASLESG